MEASAYEVLAMIMQYWFIIIILYILWRIVENALDEYRTHRQIKKEIDKHFYGYIDIEESDVTEMQGRRFGIRKENVFGRSKRCEIPIASATLEASHGMVVLRGKKLMLVDLSSGGGVFLNGERINKQAQLKDGDGIRAGETVFRINLER
ncbi:MAG: FHA domain-containing protein [Bacillota bacterium]